MRLLPFDYAARNLGRSPARLALSVLGSALVVLLILVGGGFVAGLDRAFQATGGTDNIILLGAGSEDSVERSEIPAAAPGVVAASIRGLRTRAGVAFVSPEVHVMLPLALATDGPDERARQVLVRGVTPTASLVHENVTLIAGRWPSPGRSELIVGRAASAVLGVSDADLAIGASLKIDGAAWTIVGRFAAPGTVLESEVWAPLTDITTLTRRDTISCVVITIDPYNAETDEGAEFADIDAFTKTRPDLELVAMPERAYYARLSAFFGPVKIVVLITAGLITLGGLLGGLSTLYAAFASRIRELGMLQSLGFRRTALLVSFVQEATLATAAGGLIACAIAAGLLDGQSVRFSMGAFGLRIDHTVLATGLFAGLALGIVGSVPPALRCLRPSIPVALKSV